jgi:hypothetical protein
MRSQPTCSHTGLGLSYSRSLAAGDWGVLVGLPARVIAGVLATRAWPPPVDGGLAALAAIASARTAGGALVREVVAAIFANHDCGDHGPSTPEVPTAPAAGSPATGLAACVAAGRVLAQRVPAAEAAGYRNWVLHVAAVACDAFPDEPPGPVQARLLDGYERALAG